VNISVSMENGVLLEDSCPLPCPEEPEEPDFEDDPEFEVLWAGARAQHKHSATRRLIDVRADDRFIPVPLNFFSDAYAFHCNMAVRGFRVIGARQGSLRGRQDSETSRTDNLSSDSLNSRVPPA
jgi:hypothetical protein